MLVTSQLWRMPGRAQQGVRLALRASRASQGLRLARQSSLLSCNPAASTASSASASAPWKTTLSSFSTSATRRDGATAAAYQQQAEELSVEEETGDTEGAEESNKKTVPRDSTYASLKPHISYPTYKAVTVKPFGYSEMSEVQQRVLHLLPDLADPLGGPMSDGKGGRDLLVKAKTGTGKTLAFLIPAVEKRVKAIHQAERGRLTKPFEEMLQAKRPNFNFESLDKHGRTALGRQFATNTVGTLIISPTRELATQIANEAIKLHHFHENYSVQLLVGGEPRVRQIRDWRRSRPDVVVATPGRLIDVMNEEPMIRDAIAGTQTFIMDEADTLLEMGFRDDLKKIVDALPPAAHRSTMLFSATVSRDIRDIARKSLERDHRFIDCVPEGEDNVHKHIPQFVTVLDRAEDQLTHLTRLIALDQLQNAGKSKVIVFAPTTRLVQLLSELFSQRGMKTCLPAGSSTQMYEIHSKKDQGSRSRVSERFRSDRSGAAVLFTSDVSARGVDYPGTTRVVQVGAPKSTDLYIHRIGRTGRAGADGQADIILLPFEAGFRHGALSNLPVQNRTVKEVEEELQNLAVSFDDEPTNVVPDSVWKQMVAGSRGSSAKGGAKSDKRFSRREETPRDRLAGIGSPLQPRIEGIDAAVTDCAQVLDPEGVIETFMSMVGFYIGMVQELQTSKHTIAEALKTWAQESAKLERPPYISKMMSAKLGLDDDRVTRFGDKRSGGYGGNRERSGGYGGGRYEEGGFERKSREGSGRFGRDGGFDRPRRFDGGSDRPGRFGGGDRPGRFGDSDRPSRFGGSDRPGRFGNRDGPRGEYSPRSSYSTSDSF